MSIVYWLRHKLTGELQPLLMQIEDRSVLPLGTLSVTPPPHCVPAQFELAREFEPELHCRIAELQRQTPTPPGRHVSFRIAELQRQTPTPPGRQVSAVIVGRPVSPAIVPAKTVVDPDLNIGLGLGLTATTPGLPPIKLVRQKRSRNLLLSASPLVPTVDPSVLNFTR